jgi:hypothetical protein
LPRSASESPTAAVERLRGQWLHYGMPPELIPNDYEELLRIPPRRLEVVKTSGGDIVLRDLLTNFEFRPPLWEPQGPAHQYVFRIGDRQKIQVSIPHLPGNYDPIQGKDAALLDQARQAVSLMPLEALAAVKKIIFYPYGDSMRSVEEGGRVTAAKAGGDTIHIFNRANYTDGSAEKLRGYLLHETGHIRADAIDAPNHTPPGWEGAMKADGNNTVTDYGNSHPKEDFAETWQLYMETDGGRLNPEARRKYPARFAVIDEIIRSRPLRQEFQGHVGGGLHSFHIPQFSGPIEIKAKVSSFFIVKVGDELHIQSPEFQGKAYLLGQTALTIGSDSGVSNIALPHTRLQNAQFRVAADGRGGVIISDATDGGDGARITYNAIVKPTK